MQRLTPLIAACLLAVAPPAIADRVPNGFEFVSNTINPIPFSTYATLRNGFFVTFDGVTCEMKDDTGALISTLGTTTSPVFSFASFVRIDPSETFAIVARSTVNGNSDFLYKVDLTGGGLQSMGQFRLNFDAAFESPTTIIVSAALGGFNTGNELVRVHTDTFVQTPLGHVPGSSGPVAVNGNGDLYYATQSPLFPTPPRQVKVVRWTSSQLQGGTINQNNWTVVAPGFNGGSSLAVDPISDNVFLAESVFGQKDNRIVEISPSGDILSVVLEAQGNWLDNIELFQGTGSGHFSAFQPGDGVRMQYHSTDFFVDDRLPVVRPKRPVLTLVGPGLFGPGPVSLEVRGAVPNGHFVMWREDQPALSQNELSFDVGLDFIVHTLFPLATVNDVLAGRSPNNYFGLVFDTDGAGAGTLEFLNDGNQQGLFGFQALVLNESYKKVGTTNTALN